jgi:hypothetical protein
MFAGQRYSPKETDGQTEGTLIAFNPSISESYRKWTNVIEDFIGGIMVYCSHQLRIVSVVSHIIGKFYGLNIKTIKECR